MAFYVESTDRPPRSGIVAEDVDVGAAVAYNGSGKFVNLDAGSHGQVDFEGVADFLHSSDAISKDDEDNNYGTFESAEDDRLSAFGNEDGAVLKFRTVPETTDGVTTAPNIDDGDVVGVVDTGSGDAPNAPGKVVEEGYTNDENDDSTTTTFSTSNDNFIPIGVADRDSSSEFDGVVRVRVDTDL